MLRKAWSKHKLAHAVSIMTMDNRMTVQYTSIRVVLFVCLFVCLLAAAAIIFMQEILE